MRNLSTVEREQLVALARKHQVAFMAVFGSFARGDADDESDLDLYVRYGRDVGMIDMLRLKHEIEDTLHREVDLIAEEVVQPYAFVREQMLQDLVVLYGRQETYAPA